MCSHMHIQRYERVLPFLAVADRAWSTSSSWNGERSLTTGAMYCLTLLSALTSVGVLEAVEARLLASP